MTLVASSPLSPGQWFQGSDSIIHLLRSNDVCYEIGLGNYYPRWLSQACFGKGLPTLNFYSPAFYLMVGYLNAVGLPIVTAMTLVSVGAFFISGWGVYLWTRKYCGDPGAVIAAGLYMFAPYHLVDIYLRAALPEFIVLGILPFLFHGMDLSFGAEKSLRGIVATGLASAAIVLTHNLTTVMILPFALCYFIWCRFYYHASKRRFLAACIGPFLGAGLSSFYWLPVLLEKKHLIGTGVAITGSLHYSRHFLALSDFFGAHRHDIFTFNPVYALIFVCAAVSLTALAFTADPKARFGRLLLAFFLVSMLMTLSIATPLYEAIAPLRYLQFPYRFLGPASLFLCAFCGFVPASRMLADRRQVGLAVAGLILVCCLALSHGLRRVDGTISDFPSTPVPFSLKTYPILISSSDSDFMPIDSMLTRGDYVKYPVFRDGAGEEPLTVYRAVGSRFTCRIALPREGELVGQWLYFPGWQATCDGKDVPVYPDRYGLVAVKVPAGVHEVEIRFGTTGPRVAGWIVSGTTLVTLATWLLRERRRKGAGRPA
ncbi:6-pyruvoyl-tetrahydropterin synthase-related protein [Geomesophilobacter sediminis]|uniref:Membrane protein 6-pyruvoyl-tetrahydropterin synthase-related domain-containing protein n=1 Tax=Geomesophilobacter sediminis TaxID=2798584 RepID=A0A8J7JE04_9BACT|nr:6-pyruvoyl-tetrahydropterin synthase-related protein [Geomesophilobacter sediminis]MBJ6725573.1 hypothetical protein [Geomesophilobacter sediminis]